MLFSHLVHRWRTQRPLCTKQQVIGFNLHCEPARSLAVFAFGNGNGYLREAGSGNEISNPLCVVYQTRGFVIWIQVILSQIPQVLWVLCTEDVFQGEEI